MSCVINTLPSVISQYKPTVSPIKSELNEVSTEPLVNVFYLLFMVSPPEAVSSTEDLMARALLNPTGAVLNTIFLEVKAEQCAAGGPASTITTSFCVIKVPK